MQFGLLLLRFPGAVQALDQVSSNNAQGEFYLTDVLDLPQAGRSVLALRRPDECLGVNSRIQLARPPSTAAPHQPAHMAAGVTMPTPTRCG